MHRGRLPSNSMLHWSLIKLRGFKMRSGNAYKSVIFYITGIILLYLSILLSNDLEYNGNFISVLPIILPIVFAIVFVSLAVLFIFDQDYPWFFRTGVMSLVAGLTLFFFGILSFYLGAKSLVWGGSLGVGILFILASIVRLTIQGGFSAYRKAKN